MTEGLLVAGGLGYFEAPRWIEGRLWFSDFYSRRVCSVDGNGKVIPQLYVPGQPSGLGVCPDGTLLVVSTHDGHILRWNGEHKRLVADVGAMYRGGLNDMVVDSRGRAYVSTLPVWAIGAEEIGEPRLAPIIFVDADGSVRIAADNLKVANGMVITPGGRRLIVAETLGGRLLACDIDEETGSLMGFEVFADLGERRPDGICLDSDGNVWIGSVSTSEFVLVAEGGEVLRSISTSGRWAVACALGGDNGRTLFGVTAEVTIDDFWNGRGLASIMAYSVDSPAAAN
jgi:sugar lactone lactonase YvrE